MTYVTVPDKTVGDDFTELMWDSYIKDNLNKGVVRPIAQTVLAAAAASIDFTAIAADWNHLALVIAGKCDQATLQSLLVRLNGDTTASYYSQTARFSGSAPAIAGAQSIAGTSGLAGVLARTGGLTSACSIVFPDYRRTTLPKGWEGSLLVADDNASGGIFAGLAAGVWDSTAAINRITLLPSVGQFVAGTVATLYGMGGV